MRICIDALLIEPNLTGGGETFLVNLVARLRRLDRQNEYLILVTAENRYLFDHEDPRFRCVTVIKSARNRLARLAFENLVLPVFLKRRRIELFYSPFGWLPWLMPCRSVVTFQNLTYVDFRRNVSYRGRTLAQRLAIWSQALYYRLTSPATLRRADRIWAVSHETARVLRERLGAQREKIEVIYEGVAFESFNPSRQAVAQSSAKPDGYILSIASLYPNKNLDKLIQAYARLREQGIGQRLLIVGNDWHGYGAVLRSLIAELGLTDHVTLVGGVKHDELPSYLWGADLFVLISNVEAFGLPVLEAMAAGVPVIISDCSSLPEIAGEAALTAPPNDQLLLAREMFRVLQSKETSERLRRAGIDRARRFDWNETAARAIDLFNSLNPQLAQAAKLRERARIADHRQEAARSTK